MNFWGVTNWIIGLTGLILSGWAILQARRTKRILVSHRSIDVAAALPPDRLRPLFHFPGGNVVKEAYFTSVSVENRGNTTVFNEDIRAPMRLRLESSAAPKVLDFRAFTSSRSEDVEVRQNGESAEWSIIWKHLDPGQHITIDIYTDVFIESVTSDGHFSYGTKLSEQWSEQFWGAARMYGAFVLAMIALDVGLAIYGQISQGVPVDISTGPWLDIPMKAALYLGFYLLMMVGLWLVTRYWRPGPRFIPPV